MQTFHPHSTLNITQFRTLGQNLESTQSKRDFLLDVTIFRGQNPRSQEKRWLHLHLNTDLLLDDFVVFPEHGDLTLLQFLNLLDLHIDLKTKRNRIKETGIAVSLQDYQLKEWRNTQYLPCSEWLQDHGRHEATLSPEPSADLAASEPQLEYMSACDNSNKNLELEGIISGENTGKKVILADLLACTVSKWIDLFELKRKCSYNWEIRLIVIFNHKELELKKNYFSHTNSYAKHDLETNYLQAIYITDT